MKKSDNIILIGYRGTGKSIVAQELAKLTGRKSISLDTEIEKKYKPINEIVKYSGWQKFRDIESKMIQSLELENGIIDCGGGVVEREDNIRNLKLLGHIFWLKATRETIKNRLADKTNRPSLTGDKDFLQEIEEVLKSRTPLYRRAADFEIETDYKSPDEIVDEVLDIFNSRDRRIR